jgi:4-amino-4-deoxy-L-arabinose transferase-like glycosyltransferase
VQTESTKGAAVAWLAVWVVTAFLIGATRYESRDPDSQLYAGISARLVREPVQQWIAPQWWGFWNSEGPYCEHPVGMFVVPALLGRAGYPPLQAAYAINALYQVASFALVTLIAATLVPRHAVAISALLQLLPIAFVFRVRANQEYAVLAGFLFAIYATERARTRPVWIAGMLAGFCAVLLVKGVFAFMVPVACAIWLVSRAQLNARPRQDSVAWWGVVLMPISAVIVTAVYEAAYVRVTGQSFLEIYRSRQLPEDALSPGSLVWRIVYTASWYAARVLWYPFPWSLAAVAATAVALRKGRGWPLGKPARPLYSANPGWQGAWFALATAFVLTGTFSLAHRKADRYIFPVYFLVAAAGAGYGLSRSATMARIAAKLDRRWFPAALYLVLVLLTLISSGRLPAFTFWRS